MRSEQLVACAVAGLAVALGAGPARADTSTAPRTVPAARCTAGHGTLVAVDFAHWGGPIVRGCAVGARTADEVLRAVGVTTAGDAHDGPGFVCRLGDAAFAGGRQYPTAAQQDCVNTPAASGYWSSWSASAGAGHFRYSQLGVMSATARAGDVELWTYGATNLAGSSGSAVPRFGPAALRGDVERLGGVRVVDALTTAPRAASRSATGFVIGGVVVLIVAASGGLVALRRRRGTG